MRPKTACALLLLLAGTAAAPAMAANPLIGRWMLDLRRSHFPEVPPRRYSETYQLLSSGKMEIAVSMAGADGRVTVRRFLFPAVGGVAVEEGAAANPGETFIESALGPREWVMTYMVDGREAGTRHKFISRDGRTMRQVGRYLSDKGQWLESDELFRRR